MDPSWAEETQQNLGYFSIQVPGVPGHTWRSQGTILEISGRRFIQDFIQKLRSFDMSTQPYY